LDLGIWKRDIFLVLDFGRILSVFVLVPEFILVWGWDDDGVIADDGGEDDDPAAAAVVAEAADELLGEEFISLCPRCYNKFWL